MKTFVYIDGFNLYYRLLKDRPAQKWLNPKVLADVLLPSHHEVAQVNYYTARVSSRAHDPNAPARQAIYLNALKTVPEIQLHYGNFLTSKTWMPLALPPNARPRGYKWAEPIPSVVEVEKCEEKGSDVNLGSHLVRDAFTDVFDEAVIITNDSDLVEPVRIVVQEAGKRVGLLAPVKSPTASLKSVCSFCRHIRPAHLKQAQFDEPIVRQDGSYLSKPETWQ